MNAKSFLFVAAWMKPLKTLPFLFIRNEIDRMKSYRAEKIERRRAAAQARNEKDPEPIEEALSEDANYANDTNDANACKPIQEDAPLYIISESVSKSESKSESVKKSSTTTRVRVRERVPKRLKDTRTDFLSENSIVGRHRLFKHRNRVSCGADVERIKSGENKPWVFA